jgi:site-specific DNA-methyltransferase (adenine-specific)
MTDVTLTLYNGDCLELMRDISACSVDLIICDLPYGCLSGRAIGKAAEEKQCFSGNTNGCDWDVKIDLEAFWREVKRIRKSDHSPCIHFCTTKFGAELIQSNPAEFRYDLVWDKQRGTHFLSANKMPMRSHEMIYVFSKAGAYYNRVDISGNFPAGSGGSVKKSNVYGKPNDYGEQNGFREKVGKRSKSEAGRRCVLSVVTASQGGRANKHPTEKPMELYKWLIQRYCPVGGTVLDPTFGSGNSVFTAFEMGRSAIGIEKNEVFFKKAEAKI